MNRLGISTSFHFNGANIQVPERTINHYMNSGVRPRENCIRSAIIFYKENGHFKEDLQGRIRVLSNKRNEKQYALNTLRQEIENINREIRDIERYLR